MNRPHCQKRTACAARGAGHCRGCAGKAMMADPVIRKRHRQAVRAKFADPEHAAKMSAVNSVRLKASPIHTTADKAKGGRTRRQKILEAVPLDLLKHYCDLRRDFGAAEARRMIRDLVERDAKRAAARYLKSQQQNA